MVLEFAKTNCSQNQGKNKCEYKKNAQGTQSSWQRSVQSSSSSSSVGATSNNQKYGAWGPTFKNKQNFVDMHLV
ncbi:unnamed protein product [Darwinula stevensoni]|uniref:Uncharacterized protein n=1 Tax=Darwinula stevensoni TaxID=69355 RepID=A0A7R8XE11_9CRUS|nr:unnamed protein product [Darwinula stevensoni]CAG0893815.1 unnamed protein product [Darwinula stevensoni]